MSREDRAVRGLDDEGRQRGESHITEWGSEGAAPRPVPDGEVAAIGYVTAAVPTGDPEVWEQAAAIDRFCTRRGWTLISVVSDLHRPHRRNVARPSLTHALERMRAGEASCLLVAELSRLCSSVAELGGILESVDGVGARLISLDPPIDTGTRSGRVALGALTSVSRWELARRADMTAAARASVASQRTMDPKLKRRIERMRGAGMTLQAIADALNEDGVPTVRGGAEWRPSSVQSALGYRRPAT